MTNHHALAKDNHFDNTKIQNYLWCRRGFFYCDVLGVVPTTPNIHLDYGTAGHKAIYEFLMHIVDEKEGAEKHALEVFDTLCQQLPEDQNKNYAVGRNLLEVFFLAFRARLKQGHRIVEAEVRREIEIGEFEATRKIKTDIAGCMLPVCKTFIEDIILFGTPDLITHHEPTDTFYNWDYKFAGRKYQDHELRLQTIDPQFKTYTKLTGSQKAWVIFFHCIKSKPDIFWIPCYYPKEGPGSIEVWEKGTLELCREMLGKVERFRNGECGRMLFPNRGPKCVTLNCPYIYPCSADKVDSDEILGVDFEMRERTE